MTDTNKFYITTAISYPNGAPHIGHAYELIATDVMARFQRLDGKDVYFLTGTDVHGQKMLQTADKLGIKAAELAAQNSAQFIKMAEVLGASNDDFIQTSEERHHKSCQEIWRKMEANGDIYLDSYAGWYSVRDEAYYQEDETEVRADDKRYGPQGTIVEWVEEESYFFRLSKYEDILMKLYEDQPDFIGPSSRRNEVMSFVKGGLRDLSISRTTFDWGVKVPGNDKHVMYVWVDALTNYITALGYPNTDDDKWDFWPAAAHIIGKDIVRFHAVYWPAFLMSAGIALPKRVFTHGMLLSNGEKMSKSTGNVVDPFALVDQFGLDQVRFFMVREVPFGNDGNYSQDTIAARINSDLANDIGNLAQRSLSMINKNCDAKVPICGELNDDDKAILSQVDNLLEGARSQMEKQAVHHYIGAVFACVSETNRYFAAQEPWALKKTDPDRMGTVLYLTAEIIRQVAILSQPVMPTSCGQLLDLLGVDADARDFSKLGEAGRLTSGIKLPKPSGVFPRYVEKEVE
jgi:methionyl-tRNA synthetase